MGKINWSELSLAILLLFLNMVYGYDPLTANPNGVSPIQRPKHLSRITSYSSIIFKSVTVLEVTERKVTLAIKLIRPCLPVRVHYGFYSAGLTNPCYCEIAIARVLQPDKHGLGAKQIVLIDTQKLFFKKTLADDTVCFRIEVCTPKDASSVFYDGHFSCHQTGDNIEIFTINAGPAIDCLTMNGVVVSFDTDRVCEAKVIVENPNGVFDEVTSRQKGYHHEIAITGLKPATRYHYQVIAYSGNLQTKSRSYAFATAPQTAATFRFAAMTDSRGAPGGGEYNYLGVNLRVLRDLFIDAQNRGVRMIFFPGDLINGWTVLSEDMTQQLEAWKYAVEPVAAEIPVYEGMGNHEFCLDAYDDGSRYGIGMDKLGKNSSEALFARMFVNPGNGPEIARKGMPPYRENVYFVDYAQVRFIMVNSNYWNCTFPEKYGGNLEGYLLPGQLNWLEQVLDDAEKSTVIQHVFIGTHEPAFPTNRHAKDGMWYLGGTKGEHKRDYIIRSRDRFWQMLVDHPKVAAVISGDEHNYSRLVIGKKTPVYLGNKANTNFRRPLTLFITGGAGAPLYPLASPSVPWKSSIVRSAVDYHYLLFTVSPQQIFMECISRNGSILDYCIIWQAKE